MSADKGAEEWLEALQEALERVLEATPKVLRHLEGQGLEDVEAFIEQSKKTLSAVRRAHRRVR